MQVLVWITGTAQTPQTLPWGMPASPPRKLDTLLALAEQHGVTYPEDVRLVLRDTLPSNVYAAYLLPTEVPAHDLWTWERFLNRFGEIVIRLKPAVLDSDEAIVAVLAHEAFELNGLFDRIENLPLRAEDIGNLINPDIDGNLHCRAWDDADQRILTWRASR